MKEPQQMEVNPGSSAQRTDHATAWINSKHDGIPFTIQQPMERWSTLQQKVANPALNQQIYANQTAIQHYPIKIPAE